MQNGVSSALGVIAKEVLSLEGGIVRLGEAGVTTVLYGLKKTTDQAKVLSHELHGAHGHRMPFCSAIL